MSRHGDVEIEWAGEKRSFRIGIKEWRRLQERLNVGPYELLKRLSLGRWRVDEVRDTIQIGLEGAGVEPNTAGRLVREYVDEQPWLPNVLVAVQILEAGLSGATDETLPKEDREEPVQATTSQMGKLPSSISIAGLQHSDIAQNKSTECPSGSSAAVSSDTLKQTRQKEGVAQTHRRNKNTTK